MSGLSKLALLLGWTDRLTPKCKKSRMWREARDELAEWIMVADSRMELWQDTGACEGSRGDEICEEPITDEEIESILEKHLGRPLRNGLTSGKEKTTVVRLTR